MIDAFSTCPGCGEDWFACWDDNARLADGSTGGLVYECRNLCEYDDAVMP